MWHGVKCKISCYENIKVNTFIECIFVHAETSHADEKRYEVRETGKLSAF